MMECGRCKSWVHAKCEGLSNEKYQVLSFLPDSVEFICRLCCDNPPAPWWLAVEAELIAGYLNVLKSLTKNRKACEMLKWSPKKTQFSPVCMCKSLSPSNRNRKLSSRPSLPQLDLSENFEQEQQDSSTNLSCILKDRLSTRKKCESFNNESLSSSVPSAISASSLLSVVKEDLSKEDECLMKNSPTVPFLAADTNLLNESPKPNESNLVNVDSSNNITNNDNEINDVSVNINDNNCDIKTKFNVKECMVSLKNCLPSSAPEGIVPSSEELQVKINDGDQQLSIPPYQSLESNKGAQFSPHATSQSDSGIGSTDDELKPSSSADDTEMTIASSTTVGVESASSSLLSSLPSSLLSSKQCYCFGFESLSKSSPSLLYIKNKVNSNGYSSLEEFHKDMEHVVKSIQDDKLLQVYNQILFDVFPWFDPKCSQVFNSNCNDSSSLQTYDHNQTDTDDKKIKITDGSPEYFEDTSVVLKDLLGLSRSYYYCNLNFNDTRICVLCKLVGDGPSEEEGRLLYCGHNEWVHANCALWSNEVFEEIDGSLQRVHSAISRSRLIRCAFCGKRGASVGCCYRNCPESYHFPCAKVGNCVFMEDKSIYCNLHQSESNSKPLNKDSDFAITRPIYVELIELERKKKKFIPHHQVRVMVGSLSVESLGGFVSDVSDQELSIIPCEFVCTRLYWSSVEPWRLVRYHIKTKILQSSHEYSVENDDNFTVDHSLDDKIDVKSVDVIKSDVNGDSNNDGVEIDDKAKSKEFHEDINLISAEVKQIVDNMLNTICISVRKDQEKVEETLATLSDPQTSADLLPPEIKDAIFEDLPHDILDGISMQDIFPKLMSYDEINEKVDKLDSNCDNSTIDITNSSSNKNKKSKSVGNYLDNSSGNLLKKPDELNVKRLSNSSSVNKNDDSLSPGDSVKSPTKLFLKDSLLKAETNENPKKVVDEPDIIIKNVNKLDVDSDKEKLKSSSDWKHSAILQVDGTNDYNSGDSDIGSPSNSIDCGDKVLCNPVLYVTIKDTKQTGDPNKLKPKENLDLCGILQVDGCVDSSSEYESGNDSPKQSKDYDSNSYYFDYEKKNWRYISQLDGTSDCNNVIEMNSKDTDEEPVKCMRCHRTYRTAISYERHLSTCNAEYILSCSESDSSEEEKSTSPLNGYSPSSVSNCESTNNNSESTESANNINETIESSSSSTVSADSTIAESNHTGNEESNEGGEVATSIVEPNSDFCQGTEDVVEYVVETSETTDGVQESKCINSALYKDADSPIVNPDNNNFTIITTNDDHNEIEIPGDVAVLYAPDNNMDNCILINIDNDSKLIDDNQSSTTYYITDTEGNNCNQVLENDHLKNVRIVANRNNKKIVNYNQTTTPIHTQQQAQQQQIVDYQSTPALIIQQVPSQQNVPTYVDTFSQPVQPQQNIHYITIDSSDKTAPQYPSAVLSNAYQIQSTSPAVQNVPTVVGTLIQPNGVEQLVLNTNPTNSIDVFGHQTTGGVYLSSPPPMYMNMETVVSNTVMSSSQFVSVPGSVPGMLSTYSATTTQVYQAAKPVIDIPAQSYLVINTSPSATATSALVDNSGHQVNTLPQQTSINMLQQTKQESDQWSSFQYQHQQRPVDRSYKLNEKTTVARHVVHKEKSVNCVEQIMSATENVMFNEPVRVRNCNKTIKSNNSDILKIMQNAQKIGPVHQLSKMVDNMHSGDQPSKKICLNSLMAKQKLPEAKVIPQPKVNVSLQKLDSFADKFNKKILSNNFHFNKKLTSNTCYNSNKQIIDDGINKKVNDIFGANKLMNSCEKSPPTKCFDFTNSDVNRHDTTNSTPPPLPQCFVNKESEEQFDKLISSAQRKVIVESVIPVAKDMFSDKMSNDNKVRTYLNCKKKSTPVSSAFTAQMKEQFKLQLMKEMHKNSHKYNNHHTLGDFTAGNNSSINGGSSNRVLQPTLKENKIVERLKLSLSDKLASDNTKRHKHSERRGNEWTSSSNRKESSKEQSEKTVNGKPKSEKVVKRKEISSSPVREEKLKKISNNTNSTNNVSSKKHNLSPNMIFEINSDDGFSCSTPNLADAWQKVFEAVQAARASKKLPPLPRNPYQSVNSLLKMLGLGNNSLKYMIEQLPGVSRSVRYKPAYHKSRHHFSGRESETKENSTGCARTEPYAARNKYDMFSWLASRHRRPPKLLITSDADIVNGNRRATSLNLPMAMRFRHLRETSKEAVGVFRSDIHGRGLFCLRDIDSGEMVIEYAGEVIRSALTDKREKYYTSKGIGCYMFRIDDNFVVDATMKGNAARFINHSCEPNCYSRVVDILGKKHILIFALRRIPQGEELTYDYKFPLEDDKITCHCLSRKCRKYLN